MSSTEEAPESYLAILPSSSEQYYDEIFRNFKINSDERQTLGLLDALAGICVSQAEGEAYASAMETGPETCTIFIIGNYEEVPQVTQDYLNDVCRQLTDVAHLADATGLPKPSIADLSLKARESINDIIITVVSFTFDKFLTRLTKWNGLWLKRWADIDHQLVDGAEKTKFQDLTYALNNLYEVATSHTRRLKMVVQVLASISRSWNLSNPNMAAFIRGLDVHPRSDKTDVPFIIERYLHKVLKTFTEISKLIRFAVSPRRGHIFRNQPKLMFLRSEMRRVELDIKTVVSKLERQMDVIDQDRVFLDRFLHTGGDYQYTCCPHCECAMLAILLQRWKMHQRPAPIIGVSKLSCFGCRLYFIAYKTAIFQLPEIDLPDQFLVTGAHDTLYLPWVSPDLTFIDPDLHTGVQQHLLILAREVSAEYVTSLRRYSESTTDWPEDALIPEVTLSLEDIERSWMARMNISY